MGLASSMTTALSGLRAAETQIQVSGNNLANSQTVGFKESDTLFATQFYSTQSLGAAPQATNGGSNPRQLGLGVQVAEIRPLFTQGTIEVSNSQTDLAVQGDGFFIVEGPQGEPLYTRNGNFELNSAQELVTATGSRLLGHGIDGEFNIQPGALTPLEIPLGTMTIAEATENVLIAGNLNLDPEAPLADTAEIIESTRLGNGQIPITDASGAQVTVPSSPDITGTTSGTSAGTSGFVAGEIYEYSVTFVDSSGRESIPSEPLDVTITANDEQITLNNLPTDPEFTNQVNVYRRLAGSPAYQLVGNSTQGGSFVDNGAVPSTPLDETTLSGTYEYRFTFGAPGTAETRPSDPFIVTVSEGRVHLDNLPTPTFPYTTVNVYRNIQNNPTQFFQVASLPAGTDYTDYRSDSEISDSSIPGHQPIDFVGPPITASTLLTDVVTWDGRAYRNMFQEGDLDFSGEKGGADLASKFLTIDTTTTVADLTQFLGNSMGIQLIDPSDPNPIPPSQDVAHSSTVAPGGSVTSDGRIRLVGNNGLENAIAIDPSSFKQTDPATGITTSFDMGFDSIQQAEGEGASVNFVAYDSVGSPVAVRLSAVLESRDGAVATYRWFADSPENDPQGPNHAVAVGTGLISFDGEGNLVSTTNSTVSILRQDIPSIDPLVFELDLGQLTGLAGPSELATTRQDGAPPGTLTSFAIGGDGVIRGAFSNGLFRDLGQVRMARFPNNNGLAQLADSLYAPAANSGLPLEGNPGEFGIGEIVGGALELSNTDIGNNLINLVLASTQYRSNSRVISTAQELLDEILNLRR